MTIKAELISNNLRPSGWVQVDPFDYHYDGEDPDGEVEAFLSDVENGNYTFKWAVDYESNGKEVPPANRMLDIRSRLHGMDAIFLVELPDDFSGL